MDYTFNSYNTFDTLNDYRIVYQGISSGGTITEVLKTVSISGNNMVFFFLNHEMCEILIFCFSKTKIPEYQISSLWNFL